MNNITNPDDLDKALRRSSPMTWIVLGVVIALLVSFFVWSFVYKLAIRITGKADINNSEVTLHIIETDLKKLAVGQKVYIEDKEGEILSIKDDGQPVVSNMSLIDGEYTYSVLIKEMRPFDFLIGK